MLLKKIYNKAKYIIICEKNKYYFKSSYFKIKKYKNKYYGKRCFIIGNGPSLKVEDLEKLNNEVSFGSHGIYYIYDKTDWRPTFYCAQDSKLINERYSDIKASCNNSNCFFGLVHDRKYPNFKSDDICIELNTEPFDSYPKFSAQAERFLYEGLTVTYFNIQLAVYMGFTEIYLLGVDHFYSGGTSDHFSEKDICTNKPQLDKSTCSYIAARKYADEHGIKIYNATRGGHLEVFERTIFDNLF